MVKLVFVSNQIDDYLTIVKNVMDDVFVIVYDPHMDTLAYFEKMLSAPYFNQNKIVNVGWVFHSPSTDFSQEIKLFKDIVINPKQSLSSIRKLIRFFNMIAELMDCEKPRMDLMGCCLLKNPQFEYIYNKLKNNTILEFASSDNLTGSIEGADWILESHNLNLIGLYFTEGINEFKHTLKGGNPLQDFTQQMGNAVMSASSGDWKGAIDGIGSALIGANTTLPIVDSCVKVYDVLKDPAIQTIFDCIPGLNVISFTVRMGDFIAKASKGEASDWDIALAVLDSVSLVAGFAVPGGNMSNSVVKGSVRSSSNISKIKGLAKSASSFLPYSKDLGELTQTLVNDPSEKSIDDVALTVAKIAVSKNIGKAKMSEQLKIAMETGNGASFYAIKEIQSRAESQYDSYQNQFNNLPSVILCSGINRTGKTFAIKQTQSISKVEQCSSFIIPARTALKVWKEPNFTGDSYQWCNWNWYMMNIDSIGGATIQSAICVPIRADGVVLWENIV